MIKDFSTPIYNLEGKQITEEGRQVTIAMAIMNALLSTDKVSGEKKAARFHLAVRIHEKPDAVDVTADDLADIKKIVGEIYGPLVVGQVWARIDE